MQKQEIKKKLEECFKNCALSRVQLRNCVNNAMTEGLSKDEVLAVVHEMGSTNTSDESSLCAVTAIGQALRFESTHGKSTHHDLAEDKRTSIREKLKGCYTKCGLARRQLRKCVINAINAGLTKEEVLAITDDIVGGLGKNEVSACAIVAVDQVLRYEENIHKKPLSVVHDFEEQ